MNETWEIRVLYDGECPLCSREIRFLERLDRGRGRIAVEDIAAPSFDAGGYGLDDAQVMARIHGALPGVVLAQQGNIRGRRPYRGDVVQIDVRKILLGAERDTQTMQTAGAATKILASFDVIGFFAPGRL